MKLLSIGVGLLVGPLALMLIVIAEVTVAVLSYVQDLVTTARTARKSANTRAPWSRDCQVVKLPDETSSIEEVRPAA